MQVYNLSNDAQLSKPVHHGPSALLEAEMFAYPIQERTDHLILKPPFLDQNL